MVAKQPSYKVPPTFDSEGNVSYGTWKNEVEAWKHVTDLNKKKQALALALSQVGRTREVAFSVEVADLNREDGMEYLVQKLDSVFKKDDKESSFEAYREFENVSNEGTNISDYVIEFEKRYNRIKKFNMELPDAVLAYKLLDRANLTRDDQKMVLACTPSLEYARMKEALKRTLGKHNESRPVTFVKIKQEVQRTEHGRLQKKFKTWKGKLNPLDQKGKRTRCVKCESIYHWVRNCPERDVPVHRDSNEAWMMQDEKQISDTDDNDESSEAVSCGILCKHFVFNVCFKTERSRYGRAILDTACTKTVCGENWLKDFLKFLCKNKLAFQTHIQSNESFIFGNGSELKSKYKAIIPIRLGRNICRIETEVIDSDICLLISKTTLKKFNTNINLANDKITMLEEDINIKLTENGHYCLDLKNEFYNENTRNDVFIFENAQTENEKIKIILKLHKQFGHPTSDKLNSMLKKSGINTEIIENLVQRVTNDCSACVKYKRPVHKPIVALPLANNFNDVLAVDLHQLENNLWYLHMMDIFTKFSSACIVKSKQASVIVNKILKHWISVHGTPGCIFSDNGREFNNGEMHTLAENFN